jgi:transcription elongation GreA/GreB family factor
VEKDTAFEQRLNMALQALQEKRNRLAVEAEEARKTCIEMDGRNQSRYDTQKEEYAGKAHSLQSQVDEFDRLDTYLRKLQRPATFEQIQIGHLVRLQIEDDTPADFVLVAISRGDELGDLHLVSTQSPLGKAIIDARTGESVYYRAPAGEIKASIIHIG